MKHSKSAWQCTGASFFSLKTDSTFFFIYVSCGALFTFVFFNVFFLSFSGA